MTPVKPLSVKFNPEVREKIKRIAFLLHWPEGQFVNASVAIVLEIIENPDTFRDHQTLHLARQALEFSRKDAQAHLKSPP
jgi:hypothetical protein